MVERLLHGMVTRGRSRRRDQPTTTVDGAPEPFPYLRIGQGIEVANLLLLVREQPNDDDDDCRKRSSIRKEGNKQLHSIFNTRKGHRGGNGGRKFGVRRKHEGRARRREARKLYQRDKDEMLAPQGVARMRSSYSPYFDDERQTGDRGGRICRSSNPHIDRAQYRGLK